MHSHDQCPTPRAHPFKRAAAAVALLAVTLAGCTAKPHSGSAEHPAATASAAMVPQVAGLAAMNLVFVANPDGNDQIFEQSLASPNEAPVPLTDASCNSDNPELSPAGDQLVYYSDCAGGHNQIFTLDLASHAQAQFTHDTAVQNYDPTYIVGAKNELQIGWKRSDEEGSYGELWAMKPDGSDQHNMTPGLIAAKKEAWKPTAASPDQLIFGMRERQGDASSDELYSLNPVTGKMVRLTNNAVPDWYPAKNQENELVFITKQDGHDVLATMGLDGTGRKVIVDMPGDSDDPSWGLGGRVVAFINNGEGSYDVYAYDVKTGARVRLYDGNKDGHGRALSPILVPAAG